MPRDNCVDADRGELRRRFLGITDNCEGGDISRSIPVRVNQGFTSAEGP